VGPSIAGILYDSVGFRNGTMFVVILNVIVVSNYTLQITSPEFNKSENGPIIIAHKNTKHTVLQCHVTSHTVL
jgi:hypothetical protein